MYVVSMPITVTDIAWVVLVPPMIAASWWILSRGWLRVVGTSGSQRVRHWIHAGFWTVLLLMYAISFGLLAYKYFRLPQ